MAVNKVVFGNQTIIDLTGDDVTESDVASGKLFHLPNGQQGVGSGSSSSFIHVLNGMPNRTITATGTNTYSAISNQRGECYIPVTPDTYTVALGNATVSVTVASSKIVDVSAVPDTYNTLHFIQSSGTQYIDTGITPNQNTWLYLDAQITSLVAGGLFGSRQAYNSRSYVIISDSDGKWDSGYYTDRGISSINADTNRHLWMKQGQLTILDGTPILYSSSGTFTCPNSAILFGYRSGGTVSGLETKAKVFRAILWGSNGSTLQRDFCPAQRKSDSEYGLYDTVSGSFFTKSGSGSFTGE